MHLLPEAPSEHNLSDFHSSPYGRLGLIDFFTIDAYLLDSRTYYVALLLRPWRRAGVALAASNPTSHRRIDDSSGS